MADAAGGQKKRVVVYARVSTDHEEQKTSLAAQKDYYSQLIEKHPGWELEGIYADDGISGTSYLHREAFKRMMEDCKAGKVDMILTKSVSRFARNTVDALRAIRQLKEWRIGFSFNTFLSCAFLQPCNTANCGLSLKSAKRY